jgi:serine/threonine protein kinase
VENYEEIGRGGSAVVYRGWQPEFGRWVAIKVFPPDEDVRRLERERLAVGRVSDHPGIVPVFGGGLTADGRPYLVMGYMDGGSLGDRVAARGALPPAETVAFGAAMASALQVAHDHGIWHRDLKPANILYDRFGTPRLADFGIAHLGDDGFRTGAGLISGTVAYMAPELMNGHPFTAAADVFSLGATIYYALEARDLFTPAPEESYQAFMIRRLVSTDRPAFSPFVPPWLAAALLAATEPDPTRRIQTAAGLAAALGTGGRSAAIPLSPTQLSPPVAPTPAPMLPPTPMLPPARPSPSARPGPRVLPAVIVALVIAVVLAAAGASWAVRSLTGAGSRSLAGAVPSGSPGVSVRSLGTPSPATAGTSAPSGSTGAAAVSEAAEAYRKALGSKDPLAVEVVFYPYPKPSDSAFALATLPQPAHPALADRYEYRDGVVAAPTPVTASSDLGPAEQWHFSEVSWSKMDAMLRGADTVCRTAMTAAGLPDQPDTFGQRAGVTHVIVERDTTFNKGRVVVRVYFGGGARWSGGYVLYSAAGALLSRSYCAVS